MLSSAKPFVRWWWFSGPIDESVVCRQLDWVKRNGFGGVEIAWVYPQVEVPLGAPWLSAEWARPALLAARHAAALGLGCDFTMGSAWPFGGFHVPPEDAGQTWRGPMPQRLWKSWETPLGEPGGPLLNHMDRHALARYARRFGAALGLPGGDAAGGCPGLFCDSWEVPSDGIWTAGFGAAFLRRHGYDILPLMPELDAHPDARYDYRALVAEYLLVEFFQPYTELCHELGGYSRVQCHGAPTDIVSAYALADVPESEAILFDPDFSCFAASAAAIAGKPVVSAESFTCVYGWKTCPGPGPHQGEEKLADLKLIADGLMANGVNEIVWHGMPYDPSGGQQFYATTHVGPDSPLAKHFASFNRYLEHVCLQLRRGRPYADVAVYLPLEDVWMRGELPPERIRVASSRWWELQETKFPDELRGYRPLWVTSRLLRQAEFSGGTLRCGQAAFSWLHVDVAWLDADALGELLRLARAGMPLCLRRRPRQPGRNKSDLFETHLAELVSLPNVADDRRVAMAPPLVEGEDLPDFWARTDGDETLLFLAHPATRCIRYPMPFERVPDDTPVIRHLTIQVAGRRLPVSITFNPCESALLTIRHDGSFTLEMFGAEN